MNKEQLKIKTPEYVSLHFQTAGLGSRSAAFIIDQLLLMIVNIIVIFLTITMISGDLNSFLLFDLSALALGLMVVSLFVLNWSYFFALEYFFGGRTIGKRILGIRTIQDNGHGLTLLSSFIRNLIRIIDSLPANYLVGIIMIFFHSKHKRLGDLLAGTIVVHEVNQKRMKKSELEKEIELRGLTKADFPIEDWQLKLFSEKEWNLIKTYCIRILSLSALERKSVTYQLSNIFLSRLDLEIRGKSEYDLENILFIIYLYLREEWEFKW